MFHTGAEVKAGKQIAPGLVALYEDRWTVRSLAVAAHVTILANYFKLREGEGFFLSIMRFTLALSLIFKFFVLDLVVSASDGEGFCMRATTRE